MALQRAVRLVFAVVGAVGVAASAGDAREAPGVSVQPKPAPHADLFDEIFSRGAPVANSLQTVSASFVETSTSTLLKAPQVSRGTLVGRRPNQVRLVYAGADARTVIVNGPKLALEWPARQLTQTRDIGATMRRAERFFGMSSPAELRKHFDITAIDAPDRAGTWRVTFTPRRSQMREGVAHVDLWIDKATLGLLALEMDYPGGDTRLMEFSDVRLNPPVAADAFAIAAQR